MVCVGIGIGIGVVCVGIGVGVGVSLGVSLGVSVGVDIGVVLRLCASLGAVQVCLYRCLPSLSVCVVRNSLIKRSSEGMWFDGFRCCR